MRLLAPQPAGESRTDDRLAPFGGGYSPEAFIPKTPFLHKDLGQCAERRGV
jgi:hypothetical protein